MVVSDVGDSSALLVVCRTIAHGTSVSCLQVPIEGCSSSGPSIVELPKRIAAT